MNKEEYIRYWEAERKKGKFNLPILLRGSLWGIVVSVFIYVVLYTGWYQRAEMVAASKLKPLVLVLICMLITIFFSWLYALFIWEKHETQYQQMINSNAAPTSSSNELND